MNCIARGRNVRTGTEEITGNTTNTSEWLDFDIYDRVWWLDKNKPATTNENVTLGRWLGISNKIGSDICYWVLTVSGNVIARTPVHHVIRDELLDPVMIERKKKSDEDLEKRLDDTNFVNPESGELCIDAIDDEDEVAHGDGSNTPSDVYYSSMRTEERPDQDNMDDGA